jgi:tRNA-Thr(GGU) m(6)t(6)A37 methyltransferase TsaA
MTPPTPPSPLSFTPIGLLRTPYPDRVSAPRQPAVGAEAEGRIELYPGHNYEDALSDIEGWSHLWVVFVFHLNEGWRPKVLPPRSDGRRRGVFATRSPHRPNPIGLSVVQLLGREGLVLRVRGLDMVDRSPVLDLKPYVPYADSVDEASGGWLAAADPGPVYEVRWSPLATEQARFLASEHGVELTAAIDQALALGPQPHAYRRIRPDGEGFRLAVKEWRVRFVVDGLIVTVERLITGYRPAQLDRPGLDAHRALVARFGPAAS